MSFGAAAQIICYVVYIVCNMLCVVYGRDLQNTMFLYILVWGFGVMGLTIRVCGSECRD